MNTVGCELLYMTLCSVAEPEPLRADYHLFSANNGIFTIINLDMN